MSTFGSLKANIYERKKWLKSVLCINVWHNSVHSLNFRRSQHNVVPRRPSTILCNIIRGKKTKRFILIIIMILECKPISIFWRAFRSVCGCFEQARKFSIEWRKKNVFVNLFKCMFSALSAHCQSVERRK